MQVFTVKVKGADILNRTRDLIADPKNHTTRTSARDKRCCPVDPSSDEACMFCALGALERVSRKVARGSKDNTEYISIHNEGIQAKWHLSDVAMRWISENRAIIGNDVVLLRARLERDPVVFINDYMKHEHVLQLFDEAIRTYGNGEK